MSFRSRPGWSKSSSISRSSNPDKKIVEVRVAIGEFTQIEEEQLRFCYESIITEMPIAGSRLTLEPILGKVACPHCSYSGPPKYWEGVLHGAPVATLQCPNCGKAAKATEGEECAIRSIRYTQPNELAGHPEGSATRARSPVEPAEPFSSSFRDP